MKQANNVNIRVFCKPGEDQKKIREGLKKILSLSDEEIFKEKQEIKETSAKGFEEDITIMEVFLEKNKLVNKVLDNLKEKLTEKDKEFLITQDNRLDENFDFYLRLSKPLILENIFELTDSGDCYHIKINIASFPKNFETTKKKLKEIFSWFFLSFIFASHSVYNSLSKAW